MVDSKENYKFDLGVQKVNSFSTSSCSGVLNEYKL